MKIARSTATFNCQNYSYVDIKAQRDYCQNAMSL